MTAAETEVSIRSLIEQAVVNRSPGMPQHWIKAETARVYLTVTEQEARHTANGRPKRIGWLIDKDVERRAARRELAQARRRKRLGLS